MSGATDRARTRVAVTGLGVVSSIGTGIADYTAGLRAGRSGARPIGVFDTEGFAHHMGCEVTDFDPDRWITGQPAGDLGRAARFSVAAAKMAVEDAGLVPAGRGMVCLGTTDGGGDAGERIAEHVVRGTGIPAELPRRVPAASIPVAVARELGLSDVDCSTVATACAAGNYALGNSFDAISSCEVDFALCGGADAMCRMTFTGFYRLGAVDPERCRPFDVHRQGILTGEGAGVLVLEPLEKAVARGARIYAEVLGYGLNCDAAHPVAPDQDSVAACMRLALDDAGVTPDQVDLISAHGTGTKANDTTECGAIHDVFGPTPPRTVSVKSMLGHTMGAASALSAIACAVAIHEGFIPPTINHTETDPACGIDCVPNSAVDADLRVVANNALAFGGNNAVVLFGRPA
ncbi:MAG: beta-ketoacyl-[acyl-carrier-protein] synthase family protein [Actinophytocola sp.]|uniref:beta-ketoacyl-[acyl-carrier-protein] synthase family protein n=1 Tax=Actinophytocola sp. TaxID=1872138 RepID=UPI003C785E29